MPEPMPEPMSESVPKYILGLSALLPLMLIIGLTACAPGGEESAGAEQATPAEAPLRPVRYAVVGSDSGNAERRFVAIAEAPVEGRVSFRAGGTIDKIHVRLGDAVQRGQLVAELDGGDYRLEVQRAQAALDLSQAQARNAKASYDRTRSLYENQSASRTDLDLARANSESSQAQVRANRKALQLSRQQLAYTKLTSAYDNCRVAAMLSEVNENVRAGEPIMVFGCGETLEVEAQVPENFITTIKPGDPARLIFNALPDEVMPAVVADVAVSPISSPTYPVRARMTVRDERLRVGMAAVLVLNDPAATTQLAVPTVAVAEDREGRFVWVLTPAEKTGVATANRRLVTIGSPLGKGIAITSGLSDGELVVTAGVSRIREGQQVRLLANLRQPL